MKHKSLLLPSMLLAFVLVVLLVRLPLQARERTSDFAVFDPLVDIYALINNRFYKDTDAKKLQEGAIKGMIESLDDPYTEFIPPADAGEFDKNIRGEFVGIGAQVQNEDDFIKIVSPLEDSPAYKAGIEADDLIVAVNGLTTYKQAVDQVVDKLTGEPGSEVTITIERAGAAMPAGAKPASVPDAQGEAPGPKPGHIRFDMTIVRQRIITSTVKGIHRVGDQWTYFIDPESKIAYIRVTQFTGGTIPELEKACRELVDQGLTGMILDLRFNGGGALVAAIQMADLFLKEGLIVSTRGRAVEEEKVFARDDATLPDFPLVVVVNRGSASASEVTSGALLDNERAIVLGERTFGKGIVQNIHRLPLGAGQLKITEQYYYLPSGRCIQRSDDSAEWGVDPSPGFYVPMTNEQYREMLRIRREEEVIRKHEPGSDQCCWGDPKWILDHLKDPQLSAAVSAIKSKLATGKWEPQGQDAPAGTIETAELKVEEQRYRFLSRELDRVERRIQALTASSDEAVAALPPSFLPDNADVSGGTMTITDAKGNAIATLKITGPDLARWLEGAPLEKPSPSPDPTPKPESKP